MLDSVSNPSLLYDSADILLPSLVENVVSDEMFPRPSYSTVEALA